MSPSTVFLGSYRRPVCVQTSLDAASTSVVPCSVQCVRNALMQCQGVKDYDWPAPRYRDCTVTLAMPTRGVTRPIGLGVAVAPRRHDGVLLSGVRGSAARRSAQCIVSLVRLLPRASGSAWFDFRPPHRDWLQQQPVRHAGSAAPLCAQRANGCCGSGAPYQQLSLWRRVTPCRVLRGSKLDPTDWVIQR